jgi:uncharacterized protein YndB with AHSA1/START domain
LDRTAGELVEEHRAHLHPLDVILEALAGWFTFATPASGKTTQEPPTCLAYTFRWDPPHADDRETMVTLTLEDSGEETGLRLAQRGFATEERYLLHEHGWSETFDRLELFLAAQRSNSA